MNTLSDYHLRIRQQETKISQTPVTELLHAKDGIRRKGNTTMAKLVDNYFDENATQSIEQQQHNESSSFFNQDSVSSVSTNATMDYQRLKPVKSLQISQWQLNSTKDCSLDISKTAKTLSVKMPEAPLDFKQFMDETQKEKLKREEEKKLNLRKAEDERKGLLDNLDHLKKAASLSSSTVDLISNILRKKETTASLNQKNSLAKIDKISQRLYQSISVTAQSQESSNGIKSIQQSESDIEKEIIDLKKVANLPNKTDSLSLETNTEKELIQNKSMFEMLVETQNHHEKAASIMQKPSLKQRYEELVSSEEIEFTLPYRYKLLIDAFEKLDECIGFFRDRSRPTLFHELKSNMEQSMRSTISLKQIQQIMHIYPQAYKLKWLKSEFGSEKYDLQVAVASDENSEQTQSLTTQQRVSKLRGLLIERVKYYHSLFLASIGKTLLETDLIASKVWHSEFDLQSLPSIEEDPLPLKPFELKVEPLASALNKNTVKNDLLAKLMQTRVQEQQQKEKDKKDLLERSLFVNTTNNKSGLSDKLYQLIKAKEQKIMEEKLKATKSSEANGQALPQALLNRIPEIKKIAEIILVYYIQRKVSNIFYVNLIDHIQTASTLILAQKDVIEIIDFLLTSCPFWITSIPNKQGNIIRIDKSVPLSKILAELEK